MEKKNKMKLIQPNKKYENSWKTAIQEFEDEGVNGFWTIPSKPATIEEYIQRTKDHSAGINIPENWMKATTFWLIDNDILVGHVNLRHVLVEWSTKIGGHIGFAIRPTSRRSGYGTKILEMVLPEAKRIGLKKALVTCDDNNIASVKIIEMNGGKLQDSNEVKGRMVRRYWINIFY